MLKLKNIFIIAIYLCLNSLGFGQKTESKDYIIKGNKDYEQQDFQRAEIQYRTALADDDNSVKANYNLGNSLYQQKKYNQSRAQFDKIIQNKSVNDNDKAKAYYNIGKTYLGEKKTEKAVENFKEALKLNPSDDEARYNYALAKKLLEEKQKRQQQKNQESSKNQNQNQNKSDSQNNKSQNQQQKNQESDKNQQNQKNQQGQQNDQQSQPQDQNGQNKNQDNPSNGIQKIEKGKDGSENNRFQSMDEIRQESMLDALSQQEQESLKKIMSQKVKGKRIKTEKDW